jgi:hypothetical protein
VLIVLEILRGSILSNLDEMCEWGEEDNEQAQPHESDATLKVIRTCQASSKSGTMTTNLHQRFYCAMTGDFIIALRRCHGERWRLLMSAGDGTAKPQTDDIIRSKTLPKSPAPT